MAIHNNEPCSQVHIISSIPKDFHIPPIRGTPWDLERINVPGLIGFQSFSSQVSGLARPLRIEEFLRSIFEHHKQLPVAAKAWNPTVQAL